MNGTFLIRIVSPMGSLSPNRLCQTVSPRTATFAAPSTSWDPSIRPLAMPHSRAST